MRKKFKDFSNNSALITLIMTISIVIGGIFAYILQIILMRRMSNESFLEFQRYLSFMTLSSTVFAWFSIYVTKLAIDTQGDKDVQNLLLYQLQKAIKTYMLPIFCVIIIIWCVWAIWFWLTNFLYVLLIGVNTLIGLYINLYNGILRWIERYSPILILQLTSPLTKLFFSIVLVFLGYNVFGALWWIVISSIITLVTVAMFWKSFYPKNTIIPTINDLHIDRKQIFFGGLGLVCMSLLLQIDILMIHYVVSADIWGIYASISLVAKSIVFILSSIEVVYISKNYVWKKSRKHYMPAILIFITTAIAYFWTVLFGYPILQIMKPWLETYHWLLWVLVIVFGIYTIISFYNQVLIIHKQYKSLYIMYGAIAIRYGSIKFWWIDSLENFLGSLVLLFVFIMILLWINIHKLR
jgi:O-antigen/teichoic acid export membrane protein